MKKIIFGISIGALIFAFNGCNIPFYSKYRIKSYVKIVGENFDKSKAITDQFSKMVEENDGQNSGDLLKSLKSKADTVKNLNPPSEVAELHKKMMAYFDNAVSTFTDVDNFLYLIALSDQAPEDFAKAQGFIGNGKNITKQNLAKLQELKDKSAQNLKDLDSREVSDNFSDAKKELRDSLQAYDDFLAQVLKENGKNLVRIDTYIAKMDSAMADFGSQIEKIESKLGLKDGFGDVGKYQDAAQKELNAMKSQYGL